MNRIILIENTQAVTAFSLKHESKRLLNIGANYMLKTLITTDQEDKIELANFYIKNLLPFCNVESSIATLGANNLYENVNSIF